MPRLWRSNSSAVSRASPFWTARLGVLSGCIATRCRLRSNTKPAAISRAPLSYAWDRSSQPLGLGPPRVALDLHRLDAGVQVPSIDRGLDQQVLRSGQLL